MPTNGTAILNRPLTNYAQGLSQDTQEADILVNALCPTVQTVAATGTYKSFDDRNSFSAIDTSRGLGGSVRMIDFVATDGTYNCQPQALGIKVDDREREQAGSNDAVAQQLLDEGKIRALINTTVTSHSKAIVDFVLANTTAVADRGNWSNVDVDPAEQIDEQLDALVTACGSQQGLYVVFSGNSWKTLRNHPKVKTRIGGISTGATRQQVIDMFSYPASIVVGALTATTTRFGQTTVTKSQVLGANVIICYTSPNATIYDPSAFKCFTLGTGNIQSVYTYRQEDSVSDIHRIMWSRDIKKTGSACVKRLAIT